MKYYVHLHGLLLLACSILRGPVLPAIASGQREAEALLKWKASLAAGAGKSLSSWVLTPNSSSPCSWAFITCNSAGDVTELGIDNVSLGGTLAGLDFPAFPHLKTLFLSRNDLYGTVPEGIGNLTSLVSLVIFNDGMAGAMPRSIGQLKQLAVLHLFLGLDAAIPDEIGNLTSLRTLNLYGTATTGSIPPSVGNLQKLTVLDLSGNNLVGSIPQEVGNMTELQSLFLNGNHLEGELPGTISHLGKLVHLDVSSNQFRGRITAQLENSSNLHDVYISMNSFSRLSPESICTRGGALERFVANDNGFASLHDLNFRNCSSLIDLEFASNNILGDIKQCLGMLPKQLGRISLSQNQLNGTLPPELSEFRSLYDLDLDENRITGEIPPTLEYMTNMSSLILGHNLLTGTIPPGLGSLLLYELDLSYNHFSGPLPATLRNLSTLKSLHLSSCGLNDDAYRFLFPDKSNSSSGIAFPDIEILVLSSNYINGTIPISLCSANNLIVLDLSNNALYGDIPDCLWVLPSLALMELSNNSLGGAAPSSSGSPNITLQSLHLANNRFIGNFPSFIKNCANLITLDLGGNSFTGEIPSWIAESLPLLRFLRLSSNMFDGIMPQQIVQFRKMQLLDLSHNNLTGPIPVDFANFTGMRREQESNKDTRYYDVMKTDQISLVWKNENHMYSKTITFIVGIDLSCNYLSQMIPEGLTTLRGLKYLNLSRNHLTGDIPKDIGNLVFIESLDLSLNQLEGEIPLSLTYLKFLSTLNLSNNGLSGRIPTGSQLQTLDDPSIYSNNPGLCGFPLEECAKASTSASGKTEVSNDDGREKMWLYCIVVAGFIFGFWLSLGVLLCKETGRHALYWYVDNMQKKAKG